MSFTTKETSAFEEECTVKGRHWVKHMVQTACNYAYWAKDAAATWTNHHIWQDSKKIILGTGSDVSMYWDGTNMLIVPAVDDSLIEIGDAAATQLSFDLKIYGNDANGASYLLWDASANELSLTGATLNVKTDGNFKLAGTAITATATEINKVDGIGGPALAGETAGHRAEYGRETFTNAATDAADITVSVTFAAVFAARPAVTLGSEVNGGDMYISSFATDTDGNYTGMDLVLTVPASTTSYGDWIAVGA